MTSNDTFVPTIVGGVNESMGDYDRLMEGWNSSASTAYYGDVFVHLNHNYRQVHGTLSLVVCVFGIVANVLNIIVLTR